MMGPWVPWGPLGWAPWVPGAHRVGPWDPWGPLGLGFRLGFTSPPRSHHIWLSGNIIAVVLTSHPPRNPIHYPDKPRQSKKMEQMKANEITCICVSLVSSPCLSPPSPWSSPFLSPASQRLNQGAFQSTPPPPKLKTFTITQRINYLPQ